MVRYGIIWCGMMRCSIVWCDIVLCGLARPYDVVWYGMYGMVCMVWYVWYGMYGMVCIV